MPRSDTNSPRSTSIWPKAPAISARQAMILLAVAVAVLFAIDRALATSRSRSAISIAAPVSAPGPCPQSAETFDSQRTACLRRRWMAAREIRPWRDASQDVLLEDCLRSLGGEILMPFRTNTCGNPKPLSQPPQRAQN